MTPDDQIWISSPLPLELPDDASIGRAPSAEFRPLERDDLIRRVWEFGNGTDIYGRQLRLMPDGRISGYVHDNETSWDYRGGILTLADHRGVTTTRLDAHMRDADGLWTLSGRYVADPSLVHILRETFPYQTLAASDSGFPLDIRSATCAPGARRKNLVLVFANERSRHHEWPRDLSNSDRSWDLCVSFYGPAHEYESCGGAEYSSLQTGVPKFIALHAAFGAASALWNYERVWIADDDLMLSWSDVNELFAIFQSHDLLLAQPALAPGSFVTHDITARRDGLLMRFTSFVEAMAPIFSREALEICVPACEGLRHGWGVDHVWPKLLSGSRNRIAVIDKVGVQHLRPLGSQYDVSTAAAEERVLLDAYGLRPHLAEYGGLRVS